jgi:hypothetical protein
MLDTATNDGSLPFDRANAEEPGDWSLFSATLQEKQFTLSSPKTQTPERATSFQTSATDSTGSALDLPVIALKQRTRADNLFPTRQRCSERSFGDLERSGRYFMQRGELASTFRIA